MNTHVQRVLAIDPGREKCGIAVVDRDAGALTQMVVAVDQVSELIGKWSQEHSCSTIIVGNKTASRQIQQMLSAVMAEKKIGPIHTVDEHKSSEEARQRYWLAHPPSGWRKFIPIGLLTPPCAIDDFAAIILGERYFAKNL